MDSDEHAKRLKLCVLSPCVDGSVFAGIDPTATPEVYLPEHKVEHVIISRMDMASRITTLAKQGFDCFINLCDGAWDEDRPGMDVVDLLEKLNLPYTGADRKFYDPTRLQMKKVAVAMGVKTPAWQFAYSMEVVAQIASELTFPLLVKHFNSYASIGLTKDSVVRDADALATQVQRMLDLFGGCLVEEFIEGREFTVLVSENPANQREPLVYLPVECSFPKGEIFKHFNLKWADFEGMLWTPVHDVDLAGRLQEMAQKIFCGLQGRGYGRIDVRSDQSGQELYFLEINPNCGIFYPKGQFGSADEILELDPNTDHAQFLEHIISCAMLHHQKRQPSYESVFRKGRGWGLFALRDFAEGELVQENEERPTVIVSRKHVMANFNQSDKADFDAYAWPLSEQTFVTWSKNPDDWEPINHSCDPNTWLDGLNTAARRPIKRGDELTIDYATFTVGCSPFQCSCGSSTCRGMVLGNCWETHSLQYGEHVSDRVRALMKSQDSK